MDIIVRSGLRCPAITGGGLVIILQRLLLLVRWCCYCSLGEKLCHVRLEATVTAAVGIAAAVDDIEI
jgi:hypothetical protein